MAVNNDPVFGKDPRNVAASVTAANAVFDGTGTITRICSASGNGSIVTSLTVLPGGPCSAQNFILYGSPDNGATWTVKAVGAIPLYTYTTTGLPTMLTIISRGDTNSGYMLQGGSTTGVYGALGFTISVNTASGIKVSAEIADI